MMYYDGNTGVWTAGANVTEPERVAESHGLPLLRYTRDAIANWLEDEGGNATLIESLRQGLEAGEADSEPLD